MKMTRCLVHETHNTVLTGIIEYIAKHRLGFEVVQHRESDGNVVVAAKVNQADVVLLGVSDESAQENLIELLSALPEIVVIGVVRDGERIVLYKNNVGSNELVALIQSALCNCGLDELH